MKLAFFSLLVFGSAAIGAETPQEVAKRIISSESPPAYNVTNTTETELNRAAAINSQLQLRAFMLGNTVSEELRVCYALHIIQQRIGIRRVIADGARLPATEESLIRDQEVLAAYLRRLNDAKK